MNTLGEFDRLIQKRSDQSFSCILDQKFWKPWHPTIRKEFCKDEVYFDARIDGIIHHGNISLETILQLVIDLGLAARKTDAAFFGKLKTKGDYCFVTYGEMGMSRLWDKCPPCKHDQDKYLFYYSDAIHEALSNPTEKIKNLMKGCPESGIINICGPVGGGKSFLLQYLVRKLRQSEASYRVIYLPKPELLLRFGTSGYCLLILEIAFALCDDFEDESGFTLYTRLLQKFETLHLGKLTLDQAKAELTECIRFAREFCRMVLDVRLVIALDHGDPQYDNLESQKDIENIFGHHSCDCLLTTTSVASTGLDQSGRFDYLYYVPQASNEEVKRMVKMAFTIRPPCADWSDVDVAVACILAEVGRWYEEIFKVLMNYIRCPQGLPLPYHCLHYWKYDDNLEANVEAHGKWFGALSKGDKKKFLVLLAIADCCPPISTTGELIACHPSKISFRTSHVTDPSIVSELKSNLNNLGAVRTILRRAFMLSPQQQASADDNPDQTAASNEHISLGVFENDLTYIKLSHPQKAVMFLDQRFFYIDRNLYVRSAFPRISHQIKRYHAERSAYRIYKDIMSSSAVQDERVNGKVFESSFKALLTSTNVPFELRSTFITPNINETISLSLAIKVRRTCDEYSVISMIRSVVDGFLAQGPTLLLPGSQYFPDIDALLITEVSGISPSADFVPVLVSGTQFAQGYNALLETASTCDLVLIQVTSHASKHGNGDRKLVENFHSSLESSTVYILITVFDLLG